MLPKQTTAWFGVRNYQARNFMREMKIGDRALFYHSSCPEPGIAGIVEVTKLAYPDASQFDRKGKYFDAKATRENPRWFNVDVTLVEKTRLISIAELRDEPQAGGHDHFAARQPALDHAGDRGGMEGRRQACGPGKRRRLELRAAPDLPGAGRLRRFPCGAARHRRRFHHRPRADGGVHARRLRARALAADGDRHLRGVDHLHRLLVGARASRARRGRVARRVGDVARPRRGLADRAANRERAAGADHGGVLRRLHLVRRVSASAQHRAESRS